jgi:chromosome segregation ATPase
VKFLFTLIIFVLLGREGAEKRKVADRDREERRYAEMEKKLVQYEADLEMKSGQLAGMNEELAQSKADLQREKRHSGNLSVQFENERDRRVGLDIKRKRAESDMTSFVAGDSGRLTKKGRTISALMTRGYEEEIKVTEDQLRKAQRALKQAEKVSNISAMNHWYHCGERPLYSGFVYSGFPPT